MQEEKDGKELDESQFACLKIEEERTEKQPHPVAETWEWRHDGVWRCNPVFSAVQFAGLLFLFFALPGTSVEAPENKKERKEGTNHQFTTTSSYIH